MNLADRHARPRPVVPRTAGWQTRTEGERDRIVLSEADVRILATLQRDGRISKSALAEKVNL